MGSKLAAVELDLGTLLRRKEQVVDALCKGVDGLFRKHKITRYLGVGRLAGPGAVTVTAADGNVQELTAKHVILAPGSKSATLPGIEFDRDRVGTSTEALSYAEVPPRLVVVGGGYIGMELGSVWNRLGSKVTVLEFLDRILPGTDSELAADALALFKKQGFDFRLGSRVTSARFDKSRGVCVVQYAGAEPVECDRVLVAVGRTPATDDLGLETVRISLDQKRRIPVTENFRTAAANTYAIGRLHRRADAGALRRRKTGVACVEGIVTGVAHVDYNLVPAVIFTHPEIAAVGKTEDQLKSEKRRLSQRHFPVPG